VARVIVAVLGAPGSGKTAIARHLARLLPGHVVLDWDAFMGPAGALAGRDIRHDPATWPAYRALVRVAVNAVATVPAVLLTVCTPAELAEWPISAWLLLDCADSERRRRLTQAGRQASEDNAVRDASQYRALHLPVINTTGRAPPQVAANVAAYVRSIEPADARSGAPRAGRTHRPARPNEGS
jgi:energy-coupling factor transporter ATP-binding protein EcfA2